MAKNTLVVSSLLCILVTHTAPLFGLSRFSQISCFVIFAALCVLASRHLNMAPLLLRLFSHPRLSVEFRNLLFHRSLVYFSFLFLGEVGTIFVPQAHHLEWLLGHAY